MLGPPKQWRQLTRYGVPLTQGLSWTWWRAITKARWTASVQWRQAFLAFTGRPERTSFREAEVFASRHCTPRDLIALVENLVQEGVMLPRDGRRIEEALLEQCDAQGQWKPSQGRRQSA
jgi:hypothetical protein